MWSTNRQHFFDTEVCVGVIFAFERAYFKETKAAALRLMCGTDIIISLCVWACVHGACKATVLEEHTTSEDRKGKERFVTLAHTLSDRHDSYEGWLIGVTNVLCAREKG